MVFEPYLFFSGNCEEALNFYKTLFGGEITEISRWKDAPADMGMTGEFPERIMHSTFKSSAVNFMASDSRPTTQYGEGRISLSIGTSDETEARRIWDALAKGGNVEVPFDKTFWGATFGMLTDRFGIDWMVNCQTDQRP